MLNKAQLIGRLGNDPNVHYTPQGKTIASFSIATSEKWKDKSGAKKEKTEWHNIVCFDKLADIVKEYVSKGSLLYVEGKLQTDTYEKDGVEKKITKVICSSLQMIGDNRKDAKKEKVEEEQAEGNTFTDDDIPY